MAHARARTNEVLGVRVMTAKDVRSNGEWLLSLNKMGTLMANISKFVNQIPIERMLTVNSKYYGTPRAH